MKLPEIYKNKIDENIRNNKDVFVSDISSNENILDKLPVNIYMERGNKKLRATIIGKTDNYLITSNRDVIYIKDITKLERL